MTSSEPAGSPHSRPDDKAREALRKSGLPALTRNLIHTLLTYVDWGTLVVPAETAPSLTTLAHASGISRSKVAEHLKVAEAAGWVIRDSPTVAQATKERATNGYRITIPSELVPERDWSQSGTSPHAGPVPERDQPGSGPSEEALFGTGASAGLVPERDTAFKASSSSKKKPQKGGAGGNSSRRKPETPIPDNFAVLPSMAAWARNSTRKITVDLENETQKFINWAHESDARYRDWTARWRRWILTAQDLTDRYRSHGSPAGSSTSRYTPGSGMHVPDRNSYSQNGEIDI